MLFLVVLNNVIGPINLIVCSMCLLLLFFETAFGICIGCKIYNLLNKEQAQLCPGGVCEIPTDQIPKLSLIQATILLAFAAAVFAIAQRVYSTAQKRVGDLPSASEAQPTAPVDPAEVERCKVPDFAKAMGHEEKWKLHNNCK
jgi:TRAP-type C4-dicarboxylate transport system permease small subunit